jgi:hypothetical protein
MKQPDRTNNGAAVKGYEDDSPLRHIEEALRGLRYGTVTVVVQDGVVVQIDRTDRLRLAAASRKQP